jgi:hypothetical protein
MPEESVISFMIRRTRNPHAIGTAGGNSRISRHVPEASRKKAQGGFLLAVLLCAGSFFLTAVFLTACSMSPRNAGAGPEIDAVLPPSPPSNSNWTLFRLGALRYARVPSTTQAWRDTGAAFEWFAIPSPEGAFRPVQALPAARGYFYLVDGASSRMCLYDSAVGLISTFPLPDPFVPFSAARVAVFRGSDGAFLFADYAAGEASIYTDREGVEGARTWLLRARTKMPVGWRDCYQQPGSEEIACRSGGGALRFDGALNKIPASGAGTTEATSRLSWDPGAREWTLEGFSPDGFPLFRFRPVRRELDRSVGQ